MPGTKFRKEDLTTAVTAMFDGLIDRHQETLNFWADKTDADIIDAWRKEQSDKVIAFAKRLEDPDDVVDDHELANFETSSAPYKDRNYDTRVAKDAIARLNKAKNKAIFYSQALAADENGVVEVFAADMRRLGLDD